MIFGLSKGVKLLNKSYVPVYPYSLEEAQRNGETDLYKQSRAENIACAQAIKAGISENFDGYRLNTDFLKDVIKGHGYDRTMYVLANTIQHFDIVNNSWHIFLKHSHTYAVISKES